MQESAQKALESRVALLAEHMATIRRQMEKLIAENRRMREVVRLAEGELRKRRDQVQNLESEIQSVQDGRLEARARVEHAMEQIDELISEQGEAT